jgi:spore maturation protein CgeB
MRLLYIGTLEWGCTSLQRMEALRASTEHLYAVDLRIFQGEYLSRSAQTRIQMRLGYGPLVRRVSEAVLREAIRYAPDVLWVDQGLSVASDALAAVRAGTAAVCVHYTADSLRSPGFNSRCFRQSLPEYDLCVTTKPDEAELYRRQGARGVFVTYQGFDPRIHRPVALTPAEAGKYGCDVAFVGQRMEDRAMSLAALVRSCGSRLHLGLYGRGWKAGRIGRLLGPLDRGWVSGLEYAKAVRGAKICLAFLNHEVGDTYTTRSFEIPACGSFMLAERTALHQEFFTEGAEAEYFGSNEELIEKVGWYLAHDAARRRIAAAGYQRAQRSGYTWLARMQQCLDGCSQRAPAVYLPRENERQVA